METINSSTQKVRAGAHSLDKADAEENACTTCDPRERPLDKQVVQLTRSDQCLLQMARTAPVDHWHSARSWCNLGPLLCWKIRGGSPAFSARSYNNYREPLRQRWAVNSAPGSRRLEMGDVLTLPSGKGRCNMGNRGTQVTGVRYRRRLLHDEPCIGHASVTPAARSFACTATRSSEPSSRSIGDEQVLGRGSTKVEDILPQSRPDNFDSDRPTTIRGYLDWSCGAGK